MIIKKLVYNLFNFLYIGVLRLNYYYKIVIILFISWLFLFLFLIGDELYEEEDFLLFEYS